MGRLALGRRSGWGVFVEHGIELLVGFWLAKAWVAWSRDVGQDIGWRQRRESIRSGLWWLETAWVSRSESRKTASVD